MYEHRKLMCTYKMTGSQKTREYNLDGCRKIVSTSTRLTGARKNDEYELKGAQKIDAFKMTGSEKCAYKLGRMH